MRVGLFVPCFVDQLYPQVAFATRNVLRQYGCTVIYPPNQTCCGQPQLNAGLWDESRRVVRQFVSAFQNAACDHIVAPSASCVAMVQRHMPHFFGDEPGVANIAGRTWELCQFLTDILQVTPPTHRFPFQIGLHHGCHGSRELGLGGATERMQTRPDKVRDLLRSLEGVRFSRLERLDECCGFGGTFAVSEAEVSVAMGSDRIRDHVRAGTEVLASADMSCLMHLDGILRRQRIPLRVMHVAEILAGPVT